MPQRLSDLTRAAAMAALVAVFPLVATAQASHDESRLIVGAGFGWIGGTDLWSVNRQPIRTAPESDQTDYLDIKRSVQPSVSISAQGIYFKGPHLGYAAEFTYLGLGTSDACAVSAGTSPYITSQEACQGLNGLERPASAVSLMGGAVLRPFSHSWIQPYFRGMVGAALVPRNTLEVASEFGTDLENRIQIYEGDNSRVARPSWLAGIGIATAPDAGYQFQAEFRESWIQMPIVTGTTVYQGFTPPSKLALKRFPSILISINIVLERRRGRRY